jgi:hypothetical protein
MRRADQLFGVRARSALESAVDAVGGVAEGAVLICHFGVMSPPCGAVGIRARASRPSPNCSRRLPR